MLTPEQSAALAILDRWLRSMDHPETEPPLEVHHEDVETLRRAVLAEGYRLVPEEVAQKVLPMVHAVAEQKRIVAEELIGAEERAEAFEEHKALSALASALSPKTEKEVASGANGRGAEADSGDSTVPPRYS